MISEVSENQNEKGRLSHCFQFKCKIKGNDVQVKDLILHLGSLNFFLVKYCQRHLLTLWTMCMCVHLYALVHMNYKIIDILERHRKKEIQQFSAGNSEREVHPESSSLNAIRNSIHFLKYLKKKHLISYYLLKTSLETLNCQREN